MINIGTTVCDTLMTSLVNILSRVYFKASVYCGEIEVAIPTINYLSPDLTVLRLK